MWLSKKIAAVAESAGIYCVCGGRMTLEIIRQASRHFVVSTAPACSGYAHEGPGPASQAVVGTVTKTTQNYHDVRKGQGYICPTEGDGLGIELDDEKLEEYLINR
jgi:L-alanine-DL-glutamate epimerase-like enolase superfamily enzyme